MKFIFAIIANSVGIVQKTRLNLMRIGPENAYAAASTELGLNAQSKAASQYTAQINSAVYSMLDFEDTSEAENAVRGLIAAPETLTLTDANGDIIWSQDAYSFVEDYEKAPDTVTPSLWENTRNNHAYGLFEVVEGIYQVRGYDMANLTMIAGETGWIVFDPLMSVECSRAAMQLIEEYLVNTAAVHKFINDQTLTYINQGYTSDEISNMIELPDELAKNCYTRQYYGTVAHNSKAVYQKYMGWYDANPVNLNPLTPTESAKKWVEYLGDVNEVLRMAKADYEKGQYQWVAEVTNTIVFADPQNTAARLLCADALEQLGYQAESGTWRNAYLTAALELRSGNASADAVQVKTDGSMIRQLTAGMLFDYMGILLDKQAMAEYDFTMNVCLPDVGQQHMLRIKNGVLLVYENAQDEAADVTITCPKNALFLILTNNASTMQAVQVEGNAELLTLLMQNLNQFPVSGDMGFNIVEP